MINLMPGPACLDYCSLVVNFAMGKCKSSNFSFFFFLKIILAILQSLKYHMSFVTSLPVSQKTTEILKEIGLNL